MLNSPLTTLISFPERGPYGRADYRGNYAGEVLKKLIQYLQSTGIQKPYIYDPMVGGGTSEDVAKSLNLPYIVDDIHNGFDVVNDDLHDVGFDLTMLHFPYWKMIDYAKDLPKHLQDKDMSRMDWHEFIDAVSHVNYKAAAHSRYLAVLVGDMAIRGGIKSIQREMAWPGQPVRHIIKVQHNAMSYRKQYKGSFIPIVTEHLLLFKTGADLKLWCLLPGAYHQIEKHEYVTWKTAVRHIASKLHQFETSDMYRFVEMEFPEKLKHTQTPQATIRRTLQELEAEGYLRRIERGKYVCKNHVA